MTNRYIKMSTDELANELDDARENLNDSKRRAKITCELVDVIDETIKIDEVVNSRLDYIEDTVDY